MQASALQTAQKYEKEALERIRRMGIAAAELEVRGTRKGHGAGAGLQGMDEAWFDDSRRSAQPQFNQEV